MGSGELIQAIRAKLDARIKSLATGGIAVFEFRVTKYEPAHRDRRGAYTRDEWTSVGDVGRAFAGLALTDAEYRRVEDTYVTVAVAFLREAGVDSVVVSGLENHAAIPLPFAEGSPLELAEVSEVVRRVLREEFWCRLEGAGAFVHFGWDYYMYVGVASRCSGAEALARQLGLFVEPFESPYAEQRQPLHPKAAGERQ